MTSTIILTHLCTFNYCYILRLNTQFSAMLALYEFKLLDGVNDCHLMAQ